MRDPLRKLGELIDVCRSGVDDLRAVELEPLVEALKASPALTQVLQQSQQFDLALAEALHDVPAPASDFETRLLAQLEAAAQAAADATPASHDSVFLVGRDDSVVGSALATGSSEQHSTAHEGDVWEWVCDPRAQAEPHGLADQVDNSSTGSSDAVGSANFISPATGDKPVNLAMRGRRRVLRWAVTLLTVTAVVGAFVLWGDRGVTRVDDMHLAAWSPLWQQQLSEANWQRGNPPLRRFPSAKAVPGRINRWQTMMLRQLSVTGCCYDLTVSDGGAARLLVIPASDRFRLSPLPPPQPNSTQGESIACWIAGQHVYVLTFSGRARYERILRVPTTASVPRYPAAKIG
jgi:hypothetical protein